MLLLHFGPPPHKFFLTMPFLNFAIGAILRRYAIVEHLLFVADGRGAWRLPLELLQSRPPGKKSN